MKIPKIKIKSITIFLKKTTRELAENAFSAFLVFFLLDLILGGTIFYKYIILAQRVNPQIEEKPFQFKEKSYETILEVWAKKEAKSKEIDTKQYLNPFKSNS